MMNTARVSTDFFHGLFQKFWGEPRKSYCKNHAKMQSTLDMAIFFERHLRKLPVI